MPAIVLHWALALLIVFMLCLGWYMMTVEHEPGGEWYIDLHKSFGLIVFALVLLRVLWRLGHRPEPLPAGTPRWQVAASRWTEGLLYVCMLVMPITGILGSMYSRAGLAFFGVALPAWVTPTRATAKLFFNIHSFTVWILVGLVVLHALGGLKHLLVDKDRVFHRMWFR
ncbi:cytochrome b [Caenimonas sp. DR4.4]|uniref:Cytochrome b n=2 Tax=Caenimonas aquaedulcis TaxID=2793270 RepID=A0A931H164_9BURK|nr:cytochrome b [Caenimonas aquaedulcis]MBG9386661.1 cytochrome b [Caenimonas aquaedulcis]